MSEPLGHSADLPTIGVSMGDPLGVGPEVIVKALADPALRARGRFVIYGLGAPLHAAAEKASTDPFWWRVENDSPVVDAAIGRRVVVRDYESLADAWRPALSGVAPGPTRAAGQASFQFIEDAIADAKRPEGDARRLDAIVTAPINKEAWALAGRGKYAGHTELLTTRFGAKRSAMLFVAPRLRVVLATVHIPLSEIAQRLTIGRVHDPIDLGYEACLDLGIARPRIAVCGLNPHAGENGLFGDEESRLITPAIQAACEAGIDVRGPFPADTIFNRALNGEFDLVVAMYHDQGLIPVKLLARDEAVNVTIGLPVVRTSPDHGTAFDIAGAGVADAGSMRAALALAIDMTSARNRRAERVQS